MVCVPLWEMGVAGGKAILSVQCDVHIGNIATIDPSLSPTGNLKAI